MWSTYGAAGGTTKLPTVPVAELDNLATAQATPITIPVAELLANDLGGNGRALTLVSVSSAQNGHVIYDPKTGLITFTPLPGFTGTAQFNYKIFDGTTHGSGKVVIKVAAISSTDAHFVIASGGDDRVAAEVGLMQPSEMVSDEVNGDDSAVDRPASSSAIAASVGKADANDSQSGWKVKNAARIDAPTDDAQRQTFQHVLMPKGAVVLAQEAAELPRHSIAPEGFNLASALLMSGISLRAYGSRRTELRSVHGEGDAAGLRKARPEILLFDSAKDIFECHDQDDARWQHVPGLDDPFACSDDNWTFVARAGQCSPAR